jgi:hypothetical protein
MAAAAACIHGVAGVKESKKTYTGTVEVTNALEEPVTLVFRTTALLLDKTRLHEEQAVQPGTTYIYDAGETKSFDFHLEVHSCEGSSTPTWCRVANATVVRTAGYKLIKEDEPPPMGDGHKPVAPVAGDNKPPRLKADVEQIKAPTRLMDDKLANVKGISFSFSASGWLFMYQLGVAECLQNHGICKNPYVHLSGASGGALTCSTMIYGCSMPNLRDHIKAAAKRVHRDSKQAWNLRRFVVDACCELDIKDGSYKHPAFSEGRVQICFSETELLKRGYPLCVLTGQVRQNRAHSFEDTGDVVVALLASSTMGISGMPFTMTNAEGKKVKVADSAFTSFLPAVDKFSVKVKPFSDGLGIFGGKSELMTSELVPSVFGLYPAPLHDQDHLYELGFQDAEMWVEDYLDRTIRRINAAPKEKAPKHRDVPDKPPVSFTCEDDGVAWQEKVNRAVPVEWTDMKDENHFHEQAEAKPFAEGILAVEVGNSEGKSPTGSRVAASFTRVVAKIPALTASAGLRSWSSTAPASSSVEKLHCVVTHSELRWGVEALTGSQGVEPSSEQGGGPENISTLPDDGAAARCRGGGGDSHVLSELGPRGGAIAIAHIKKVQRSRGSKHVVVETHSKDFVRLTTESDKEAVRWQSAVKLAMEEHRRAAQETANCRPDSGSSPPSSASAKV